MRQALLPQRIGRPGLQSVFGTSIVLLVSHALVVRSRNSEGCIPCPVDDCDRRLRQPTPERLAVGISPCSSGRSGRITCSMWLLRSDSNDESLLGERRCRKHTTINPRSTTENDPSSPKRRQMTLELQVAGLVYVLPRVLKVFVPASRVACVAKGQRPDKCSCLKISSITPSESCWVLPEYFLSNGHSPTPTAR